MSEDLVENSETAQDMSTSELRQRKPTEGSKPDEASSDPKKAPPKRIQLNREKEAERWNKMLTSASEGAPPSIVPYLKAVAPVVSFCIVGIEMAIPFIATVAGYISRVVEVLPFPLLTSLLGLLLCFFGGMYPTTVAAGEAYAQAGGKEAIKHLQDLYVEFKTIMEKSAEDDLRDDDGDGIADVDQISAKELLMRKSHIALTNADPDKLNGAIQGLYTGWIGVVAVLKVQFAKTIALGAAIGSFIYKPALSFSTPILAHLVPKEYHRWIPSLISYICKAIAISIAWYVQRIISAFHSAIRGGLMFSRSIMKYLNDKKIISFDDTESYMDEIIGWSLAALGFYFQFTMGFMMPFPLNLLLWPLGACERYIQWTISD